MIEYAFLNSFIFPTCKIVSFLLSFKINTILFSLYNVCSLTSAIGLRPPKIKNCLFKKNIFSISLKLIDTDLLNSFTILFESNFINSWLIFSDRLEVNILTANPIKIRISPKKDNTSSDSDQIQLFISLCYNSLFLTFNFFTCFVFLFFYSTNQLTEALFVYLYFLKP